MKIPITLKQRRELEREAFDCARHGNSLNPAKKDLLIFLLEHTDGFLPEDHSIESIMGLLAQIYELARAGHAQRIQLELERHGLAPKGQSAK